MNTRANPESNIPLNRAGEGRADAGSTVRLG